MMSFRSIAAVSIPAWVFAAGLILQAQAPAAGKADPVKVDPKHYKIEFENDSVRVLRISYGPGEKSVMHSHPKSVAVYLTDGTGRMTTPDGKSQDIPFKAGETVWADAGTHLPQNAGSGDGLRQITTDAEIRRLKTGYCLLNGPDGSECASADRTSWIALVKASLSSGS